MSTVDMFMEVISEASQRLAEAERILILFSDDGDGLASALLLKLFTDSSRGDAKFICLDKIYPEIMSEIMSIEAYDLIIFTDLGGPIHKHVPSDRRENVLIIDHHVEYSEVPSELLYLNPYLYGLANEDSPVSSTISYLLYKNRYEAAKRWAWLAVLGMGESPYPPSGLNWRALYDGLRSGAITKSGKSFRIVYRDIKKEYRRLYKDVTLISSVGYYKDSYLDLFNNLINGDNKEILESVKKYEEMKRKAFKSLTSILEVEGLNVGNSIQWFEDYNKDFFEMGTRVFDSYVSYISYQARLYDKAKYIIGLCERNPYIPGFGYLTKDWINVAIRVSKSLEFKINIGRAQPVSALVEAAAYTVGGLGYGYESRGAAVIPYYEKEHFLEIFDSLASEGV